MKERPILFSAPMVRAILDGSKTQTRRICKQPKNKQGLKLVWDLLAKMGVGHACPYGKVGDRLWVRETWKIGAWREDGRMAIDYIASPEIFNTPWLTIPNDEDGQLFERYWIESTDDLICSGAKPGEDGIYKWSPGEAPTRKRPSIFMPRWACRIELEITGVRVERLQDISEDDAKAEGAFFTDYGRNCWHGYKSNPTDAKDCAAPYESHQHREGWSMVETKSHQECLGSARFAFGNFWNKINGAKSWHENPWVWVIEFNRTTKT